MKKIIALMLCFTFVLCLVSCGSKETAEEELKIPFQKIASANKRSKILEKYGSITERTASKKDGEGNFWYWLMYYEKDGDNTNAILEYEDYKCYYYNNEVFAEYDDGIMRRVLTYRESYDAILLDLMARNDTLSYVYISNESAEEDPDEEGYIARYEFKVNSDNIVDLEGLGIKEGDMVEVEYDLDKEYIIKKCRYYLKKGESRTLVARIDVFYGEKVEFPPEVVAANDENKEFVDITIVENFGTGSQYSETFRIAKGGRIIENDILMKYYLFKDPVYQNEFIATDEVLNENLELFIVETGYIDSIRAEEEHKNKVIEEYNKGKQETR